MDFEPLNQQKLLGYNSFFVTFAALLEKKILPNKMIISGPKGNGKTEWTLGLTDIISKGGSFLTYKVNEPRPVIYIDGEMDEYDLIIDCLFGVGFKQGIFCVWGGF